MEWLQADEPPAGLLVLDEGIGVYFYSTPEHLPRTVPVLFSSNLKATHRALADRAVACTAIQQDRTGRSYFEFHDLDGNAIEVCAED